MMTPNVYTIRKALLVPVVIDVVLLFALLLISFLGNGSATERFVLVVLFVPLFYFSIDMLYRKVTTSDQGMMIQKLFRKKNLLWGDINHEGHLVIRKKVYILLTTLKGFQIVSNAYANFPIFVKDIFTHMEKEKIEEQLAEQIENPVRTWPTLFPPGWPRW